MLRGVLFLLVGWCSSIGKPLLIASEKKFHDMNYTKRLQSSSKAKKWHLCSVRSLCLWLSCWLTIFEKKILYKTHHLTVSVKGLCPDGTFTYGNSCYLELNIRATWAESSVSCHSKRQIAAASAGKQQCHFSRHVSIVTSALCGGSRQQGWSIYH